MEVLIAGAVGGREHALGLALHEEGANVHFTHGGNGGTQEIGTNIESTDIREIADYAESRRIELVVIGPEAPLVAGLADILRSKQIPTFGPGQDGARLEGSKVFTAEFAREYGIRQPNFEIVRTMAAAKRYIGTRQPEDYVTKADGLAGGKGALLHRNEQDPREDIYKMLRGILFEGAGRTILFQDRLDPSGPELSAEFLFDGSGNFTLLPLAQDHKRLERGDKGPNTGGMGAYAPLPFEDPVLLEDIMDLGERIAHGLAEEGINYRGVVYAGLMRDVATDNKPSLLEINVRFGDPEIQVVIARLQQAGISIFSLLEDVAYGSLDHDIRGTYLGDKIGGAALTVCLAAGGYPDSKANGLPISGLDRAYEDVTFHHAGTMYDKESGQIIAVGGRVGYVTAKGNDADDAYAKAEAAIGPGGIDFQDMRYRDDIAWQARKAA